MSGLVLYSTRSQSALFDAGATSSVSKKCRAAWKAPARIRFAQRATTLFFRLPCFAKKCAVKNAHILTALSITFLAMISTATADHNLRERLSWRPETILRQGLGSAPWTRDPFFPATHQWSLTGIVSEQLAFINGSWVRLGEKVGKYVVKKIEGNRVVLAKQKEEIVLTLRK